MGWLTVGAYVVAACFALAAYRAARLEAGRLHEIDPAGSRDQRRLVGFWLVSSIVMMALGVNKQLDLQTFMTQVFRDLARAQGWYENRRQYQVAFISFTAIGALASGCTAVLVLRPVLRRAWLGLLGLTWILSFVLIRAASFHHVDRFLRGGGMRWNWVLELGGIALVGVAGYRAARRGPPSLERRAV